MKFQKKTRSMLKILICLLVVFFLIASLGCVMITPNGTVRTDEWDIAGFTKVHVESLFDVNIIPSTDFRVVTNCDTAIWEHVEVVSENNELNVSLRSQVTIVGNCLIQADIYMPVLTSLRLDGASRASVGDFMGGTLCVSANGASKVILESLDYSSIAFDADGASNIRIVSLTTPNSSIDLDGASSMTVNAAQIGGLLVKVDGASSLRSTSNKAICDSLEVHVNSASSAAFDVAVSVSGSVSSASTLYLGGKASYSGVNKDISSRIIRR